MFAFRNCSALTLVIIKGKPTVRSMAFNSTSNLKKIYVLESKGYSTSDKIDGKPIEILPAEPAVIAKKVKVKSLKI